MKSGLCDTEKECPNYCETWWQEGQTGQPKLVKDCVPKRLMIQLARLERKFENVQVANNDMQRQATELTGHFKRLIQISNDHFDEQKKINNESRQSDIIQ